MTKRNPFPLKRSQKPLKRSPMKRSTSKLGPGKKTANWNKIRAQLKRIFERQGRVTCEFTAYLGVGGLSTEPLSRCTGLAQGFAHSRKRRELSQEELHNSVALACLNCHDYLDTGMSHAEMYETVTQVIKQRGWIPEYDATRERLTGRVVPLER